MNNWIKAKRNYLLAMSINEITKMNSITPQGKVNMSVDKLEFIPLFEKMLLNCVVWEVANHYEKKKEQLDFWKDNEEEVLDRVERTLVKITASYFENGVDSLPAIVPDEIKSQAKKIFTTFSAWINRQQDIS